jgi:hypothetical protein
MFIYSKKDVPGTLHDFSQQRVVRMREFIQTVEGDRRFCNSKIFYEALVRHR